MSYNSTVFICNNENMQPLQRDLVKAHSHLTPGVVTAFIKRAMPLLNRTMPTLNCQNNPSTAIVLVVLVILSSVVVGENLEFCSGGKIINERELTKIKNCDVIEGHLILAMGIFETEKQWHNFGSLKVREITDYLIIAMVDHLRSLDLILPNLTVIRGYRLYMNYGMIVYINSHLEEINLKNLNTILKGSVFIKGNNALNGYVNRVDWNSITSWNNKSHCKHPNEIQVVNEPRNCNDTCRTRGKTLDQSTVKERVSCWSSENCQKKCHHSSGCTAAGEPCHEQCVGGCFVAENDTQCVACKGFRKGNQCVSSCGFHYELDEFLCITDVKCFELGRKEQEMNVNTAGVETVRKICVEKCLSGFQETKDKGFRFRCEKCKGNCVKQCDGGVIDSLSKAEKYKDCTIVEGNLEIILFGTDLLEELQKYLGSIEVVSGYVRVFKSTALPSLEFLGSLRSIEGRKLWKEKYSLIINDNDELQGLWTNKAVATDRLIKKGEALIYSNPKLCPQLIGNLLSDKSWSELFPALNGNKKACFVNDKLVLDLTPLDVGKGVMRVQIRKDVFNETILLRLAGFHVYYTQKLDNVPCSDHSLWSVTFQEYKNQTSSHLEAIISGLKPAQNYCFYIETLTVNAHDNFGSFQSGDFENATLPYYPSTPENVSYSITENIVEIQWDSPLEPNGNITHYEITVTPHELITSAVSLCDSVDSNSNNYQTTEISDSSASNYAACSSKFHTNEEKIKELRRNDDNLENELHKDISSSRIKREAISYDYAKEKEAIILESNVGKRLFSRQKGLRKVFLPKQEKIKTVVTNNKNPEDILLELEKSAHINDLSYFENKDWSNESLCASLRKLYEMNPSMRANSQYIQICTKKSKLEEANTEAPSFEDKDTIKVSVQEGRTYNLTNLKSNSSYLVKIKACHKPTEPSRLCTGLCKCSNVTSIIVFALDDEEKVRVRNITVSRTKGDNFTIRWQTPKMFQGINLAYNVEVKGPVNPSSLCVTSLNTTVHLPNSGHYTIKISTMWGGQLSFPNEIFYSINNDDNISEYPKQQNTSLIYLTIFFVVFILTAGIARMILRRRNKCDEIPINPDIRANCCYYLMHPTLKKQLYDKIAVEKLYSKKDFKKIGLAGEGKFGIVYKGALRVMDGNDKKKYIPVAAKQIKNHYIELEIKKQILDYELRNQSRSSELINRERDIEIRSHDRDIELKNQDIELTKQLIDEASLMLSLESYNLIRTYGVMCENYELSIMMELMDNGNLNSYMKSCKKKGTDFTLEQVMKFGVQIADGMAYLADKGVVHRDLAARNCLLDKHLNVKISDFGMARVLEDNAYISLEDNKPVPIRWMPPEYFNEERFVTNSDVYSYGILLWEIVNPGELPYREVKEWQVQDKVMKGVTLITSIPSWVPIHLRVLMGRCWHFLPDDRPSFRDIIEILLNFTCDNFKEDFKTSSFYHCGELNDCEPKNRYYPIPPDEDDYDVSPSTPLTTPTAENAENTFADTINVSNHSPNSSPRHVIQSMLRPISRFRDLWPWPMPRYSLDFATLPCAFTTTSVDLRNKHGSTNMPSNKPDVLPSDSRTIP